MIRLFDAFLGDGNIRKACDALERLVDIDSYDYRNQERLERLKGKPPAPASLSSEPVSPTAASATVPTRVSLDVPSVPPCRKE